MFTRVSTSVNHVLLYFQDIVDNFGIDFSVCLLSIFFGMKGLASQLVTNARFPYFKELGITGVRYQSFIAVANTPWAMKAAIGLLSDAIPLFGYHKRSYIVIVSIIGGIGLAVLTFVNLNTSFAFVGAMLLILFEMQGAAIDLLTEAKYAEMMVNRPDTGSSLVSFAWALQSCGGLFGSLISAAMLAILPPRFTFLLALPLAAQVIVPAVTGWFPEERLPPGRRGIRHDKISQFPDLFKLAVLMTIGAILVGGSGLFSPTIQSNVSLVVSLSLALLGFIWLPQTLRRANLYLFLDNMLYLTITGPMDYWMTAGESCVPGGPNFSPSFYVSYANFVGCLASVLGVVIFQMYLSRGTFRNAFLVSGIIKVAASIFDFIIIKRYNRRIGISDMVFFTLGDAVIFQATNRIELMPSIVLTSKVCPRGMEASVYALLVSYQNIGIAVSRTLGDALVSQLGIKTTEPCNFDNLPLAVLIAHVLLPSLVFPLIFLLVPDAYMTDDLVTEDAIETMRQRNHMSEDNYEHGVREEGSRLLRDGEEGKRWYDQETIDDRTRREENVQRGESSTVGASVDTDGQG